MNLNRKELGEHVAGLISNDRNITHGDPQKQFTLHNALNLTFGEGDIAGITNNPVAAVAINHIFGKLSRLAVGQNLQDTWLDIAGYALIAAEQAEKPLTKLEPQKPVPMGGQNMPRSNTTIPPGSYSKDAPDLEADIAKALGR